MNLIALLIAAATLIAAPGDKEAKTVTVRMVAVHASSTGQKTKQFGSGTEEVRSALSDLNFDTYKLVKSATANAPYGKETQIPIDATYTLYVTPVSKDAGYRIKVEVRIAMPDRRSGGKSVNAVTTTAVVAQNSKFKLRGLPLDQGELVVVLSVKE